MRKIILFLTLFVLGAMFSFGQTSPSDQLRVRTKSTVFNRDIPIGTSVFFVSDSTYYVANRSIVKTTTFNDHPTYWTLIGGGNPNNPGGTLTAYDVVEEFTETAQADSGITHCLIGVPLPESVMVELNGSALARGTTQWSTKEYVINRHGLGPDCSPTTKGKMYVRVPVYEYDKIRIRYRYTDTGATPQ